MAHLPRWFLILTVCLTGFVHAADKRVALVIGNAAYSTSPLKNPVNDARAIATKLQKLGFDVVKRENLTTKQIGSTLREFRSRLAPGAEALFFYAGHGLQVKGVNYLPAVDADISAEEDVPTQSIEVSKVLEIMDDSKTRLNLIFLDACRNNPFTRRFRSAGGGLAKIEAPSGTKISFATRPGSVAADGEGSNGLYTEHLLRVMDERGLPIEQVLKRLYSGVKQASKGAQEPWEEGTIEGEFYFQAGSGGHATQLGTLGGGLGSGSRTAAQIEDELWDAIKGSEKAGVFEEYIKQYPKGRYVAQARVRIAGLMNSAKAPAVAAAVPTGTSESVGLEEPRNAGPDRTEEARRFVVRGIAAIEMAKSESDLVDATQEFRKATQLDPGLASAWFNLGVVEAKLNHHKNAIEAYQRYLTLNPSAEDAVKVRNEVVKLDYQRERYQEKFKPGWTLVGTDNRRVDYYVDKSKIEKTSEGISIAALHNYPSVIKWGEALVGSYQREFVVDCIRGRYKFMGATYYAEHMGNGVVTSRVTPANTVTGVGSAWQEISSLKNDDSLSALCAVACRYQ